MRPNLIGITLVGLSTVFSHAERIHVDSSLSDGAGDGSSWGDAYTDLQSALDSAAGGDEVWVASGTYLPTAGNDRTLSFVLEDGVAVYGGFAGGETSLGQRNPVLNRTILSGDLAGDDVPGDSTASQENSFHVVWCDGASATAVLDGFSISGGNANGKLGSFQINSRGGGIYLSDAGPTLANLEIFGNFAGFGGGIYASDGTPRLTGVTVSDNSAGSNGGGLYISGGDAMVTEGVFTGNRAGLGGAVYLTGSGGSLDVSNTLFSENQSTNNGAAIAAFSGGLVVEMVSFIRNISSSNGAGIYMSGGEHILENAFFSGNAAGNNGAGFYISGGAIAVENVALAGNRAENTGGGMYFSGGVHAVANTSFAANSAANQGGGIYLSDGIGFTLSNSVLWKNTAAIAPQIRGSLGAASSNNLVESDTGMPDPLFTRDPQQGADLVWGTADDDYGDLAPRAGSPMVNAGSNSVSTAPSDLAENTRIFGGTVDIGAYELQSSPSVTDSDGDCLSDRWESLHPDDADPFDDSDNDGINALSEFAYNLDPDVPVAQGLPTAEIQMIDPGDEGGAREFLTITFRRGREAAVFVDFIVEYATGLTGWSAIDTVEVSSTEIDAATDLVTVRSRWSVADEPRGFFRLRINCLDSSAENAG